MIDDIVQSLSDWDVSFDSLNLNAERGPHTPQFSDSIAHQIILDIAQQLHQKRGKARESTNGHYDSTSRSYLASDLID